MILKGVKSLYKIGVFFFFGNRPKIFITHPALISTDILSENHGSWL